MRPSILHLPSMPLARTLVRACAAGALALAAACADSPSAAVQPVPAGETPASAVRLLCTGDVATRTVRCDAPGASQGGPRADRIYGQGTGMKVTSSNIAIVADSFTFDMTVTSNLEYPVGTTDGVNPDPNGIRVFFVDGIHTTAGTGTVTVANADGVDAFTAAGQAYFAYPGVLQPEATTAAKKWKLQFDAGVEQFSFGLYISTPVPSGGGSVALTILEPAINAVFRDSMRVRARIDFAPASIQSVKASVADRVVVMTPYGTGLMQGTLSLAGLPHGSHQIRVHAVTVRADTGDAYRTIRKDLPPTIVVTAPRTDYVATPQLRIDAECVDDSPSGCAAFWAETDTHYLAQGTTSLHATTSLASYAGKRMNIKFTALDGTYGVTQTVPVYVQSGRIFVDSAGTRVLDVDASRTLFADSANTVWMRDRTGGTRTQVQASTYGGLSGYLLPLGAIFGREGNGRVYELRNGTVESVGTFAYGRLAVAGSWAAWAGSSGGAFRRDLLTGATEGVGAGGPITTPDIGANGDLVWSDGIRVFRYQTFPVTSVVDSMGTSPLTDGTNVVYLRSASVTLWNGTTRTVLSNALVDPEPHSHYEVNAGWVAYVVRDGGGATQVRVRSPGGTDTQVTSAAESALIRGISSEGTLLFARSKRLYLLRAPYTAAPTYLGTDWFRARFRGTELQLYLGNSVFTATY